MEDLRQSVQPTCKTTKVCGSCKETKTIDLFYSNKSRSDGKSGACKACDLAKVNAYNKLNCEQLRIKANAKYAANPEKHKQQVKDWRKANPEKAKELDSKRDLEKNRKNCAAYRITNIDKIKEREKHNRLLNVEKTRKFNKIYKLKNKEELKEKRAIWLLKNPDKLRMLATKRKCAKLQRTPQWVDMSMIAHVYAKCPKGYEVDHIVPLQGKLVSGLHVHYNLQHLTVADNATKNNKFDPATYVHDFWK